MNIFVYADKLSKLAHCQAKTGENEHFSPKEILKKIDKKRAAYRELFSEEDAKLWFEQE